MGGVRDGALLGLGAPVPPLPRADDAWRPPASDPVLVELRHVSGPGAGRVWRLGPGSYEAGTDRSCVIRLAEDGDEPSSTPGEGQGGAPAAGVWITVRDDGSVTFRLPADADPDRCGLRSLTPPPPVDEETGTPLTDEEPEGRQDGGPGGHSEEPPPAGPDGLPQPPPLPPPGQLPPPDDGSVAWPPYADLALGDHLLRITDPSGATFVYSGDTGACDALVELARGGDVFLCEASWPHSPPHPPDLHLSGTEAGQAAAMAGVRELLLTHIPQWTSREDVISEAKAEFDGPVHAVVGGAPLVARVDGHASPKPGEKLAFGVRPGRLFFFDTASGKRLRG